MNPRLPTAPLGGLLSLCLLLVAAPACDRTLVPPHDPDELLTDRELAITPDPDVPPVPAAWAQWIAANHHPIRSLHSRYSDDLQFLKPRIGTRRLVQLGESGHGVREFNRARVRLIRFLHQEMGFEVLAFESGIYDCWYANERLATATAEQSMRDCIYGVWHTEELVELFEYVRHTQGTNRPLILAGFDMKNSASHTIQSSPAFLHDVIAPVDAGYAARARDLETSFYAERGRASAATTSAQGFADSIRAIDERERLTVRYDSLLAFIDARLPALIAARPHQPGAVLVARQAVYSRPRELVGMKNPNSFEGWDARDRTMAEHLDVLMDEVYPGKKVMVWAHNAHVMHNRETIVRLDLNQSPAKAMGGYVAERRRAELYTIGLFMYRGSAAFNSRQVYTVQRPLENSLEALFHRTGRRWAFVDLLHQPRSAGTEWMYTPNPAKEWGIFDYDMVIRDAFDAILFVDAVTPPQYR